MIVEYVRYRLTQHSPEVLLGAYAEAAAHLRAAPECLGYEMARCAEEAEVFTLRILWRSAEDHLTGFRQGPHFPPFLALVRPFLEEIEEMRHYIRTDLVSDR